MSEVLRWKLKGFIPGVEGVSKALFQPWVVSAEDFDHVTAERDGLQQLLTASNERLDKTDDDFALLSLEAGGRIELLEKVLAGLLFEFDDGVNGGQETPVPALDLARTLVDAAEFKPTEGESDDA